MFSADQVHENFKPRVRRLSLKRSDRPESSVPTGLVDFVPKDPRTRGALPGKRKNLTQRRKRTFNTLTGRTNPGPWASRLSECGSCSDLRRRPPLELTTRNATPLRLGVATPFFSFHLLLTFAALREVFLRFPGDAPRVPKYLPGENAALHTILAINVKSDRPFRQTET